MTFTVLSVELSATPQSLYKGKILINMVKNYENLV